MMRLLAFSNRNRKEMLRDPLQLAFTLGLPVVLMALMTTIGKAMPPEAVAQTMFGVELFAPSMAVFSLSFLALFTGMLVATDRTSSFLTRLFTSPLTVLDFCLGYLLPLILVGILQTVVCFGAALLFGLPFSANLLLAIVMLIPVSLFYVALGILLGTLGSIGLVTGIGNVIIQAAALLSGTWFSLSLVGGVLEKIGNLLPFAHAVALARDIVSGQTAQLGEHLLWIMGYAILLLSAAVWAFHKRMHGR